MNVSSLRLHPEQRQEESQQFCPISSSSGVKKRVDLGRYEASAPELAS